MASYWLRTILVAVRASFDAIGQTPGAVLFSFVVVAIGASLVWRKNGWLAMKAHVIKNSLEAVAIGMLLWMFVFAWSCAGVVYRGSDAQAKELQDKTTLIVSLQGMVKEQRERVSALAGAEHEGAQRLASLNRERDELRAALARNAPRSPGPVPDHWGDVIRPDQHWETLWRDNSNPCGVKVELRPTNPPTGVMSLHVTFINSAGTEGGSALFRPVRIESSPK